MTERSILRIRTRPHSDPDRKDEWVVEVWRNAEVVASIYGSREGLQIASQRFQDGANMPFGANVMFDDHSSPTVIVPLLAPDEMCPWCGGTGKCEPLGGKPCPVCRKPVSEGVVA